MEAEFHCGSSSNNGNDTPLTWIQSTLSDLEENTKSMLSLIKPENGRSIEECVETYYKKKPELEKQLEQFQKLYHLLLDQYTPILCRFPVSSISTANQPESKFDLNPQSHNIDSSNLGTEPCLQHVDRETQLQNAKNAIDRNHKSLQENCSLSDRHCKSFSSPRTRKPSRDDSSDSIVELSVEAINSELEKNTSKLSESSPNICSQNVFEHWIDFEKRVSTSEVILELAKDNKTHMDLLLRRYEDQNRMNNRLKEHVEGMMRENQLLHDENLKLMSENKLLVSMIQDQVMGGRGSKIRSSCYGLRMMKNGLTWLKSCIMSPCM